MTIKKIFKIAGIVILILVIGYLSYVAFNVAIGKSKLKGEWEATSANEGCFQNIKFHDGYGKLRPITLEEVEEGEITKIRVWMGWHKIKGDKIHIEFWNFKEDPLEMKFNRKDTELNLQYRWKENDYHCTYQLIGN
ncbi:hypothetical protein K0H71_00165 [Bacillus sp. IITD106]|nr:hypothetical protein [Bacillus sp. IITD106]